MSNFDQSDYSKLDALIDALDDDTKRNLMRLGFLCFKRYIYSLASILGGSK